ncbi:MAG: hypothetical protein MUO40_07055, partial [Anaerolineaceae bacterium]|nr:hypothetical protein [Anaerolineaceae bacterium]
FSHARKVGRDSISLTYWRRSASMPNHAGRLRRMGSQSLAVLNLGPSNVMVRVGLLVWNELNE